MYLYFLVIVLLFLTLFNYIVSGKDLIHPCFIICLSFFVSACSAVYNVKIWNIQLSATTFFLIVLSLSAGTVGCILGVKLKAISGKKKNVKEISFIEVDGWKCIVLFCFGLFTSYLYYRDIMRIISSLSIGGGGWTAAIGAYRSNSLFAAGDAEMSVSSLTSNLYQVFRAVASVFAYILANNIVYAGKKGLQLKILFPVIVYIACSILTGGRMPVLKLIVCFAVCYLIILRKKRKTRRIVSTKLIGRILAIGCGILFMFSQVRTLVGRDSELDFMSYITMYTGGSIELLDLFVKDPLPASNIWGKETFYSIYASLARIMNRTEWSYSFAKEFRMSNGITVGNVYSALRCFYYDYGFLGCILSTFIVCFVLASIYKTVLKHNSKNHIDILLLVYAYYSYIYFFFSINNYIDVISPAFIKNLLFYLGITFFLFKMKLFKSGKIKRPVGLRIN